MERGLTSFTRHTGDVEEEEVTPSLGGFSRFFARAPGETTPRKPARPVDGSDVMRSKSIDVRQKAEERGDCNTQRGLEVTPATENDDTQSASELGAGTKLPDSMPRRTLNMVLQRLKLIDKAGTDNDQSSTSLSSKLSHKSNNDDDLRQYWMPDDPCQTCYNCGESFTLFRRRHHCRICGQVFCWQCCRETIPGQLFGRTGTLRVCEYCLNVIEDYRKQKLRDQEQGDASAGEDHPKLQSRQGGDREGLAITPLPHPVLTRSSSMVVAKKPAPASLLVDKPPQNQTPTSTPRKSITPATNINSSSQIAIATHHNRGSVVSSERQRSGSLSVARQRSIPALSISHGSSPAPAKPPVDPGQMKKLVKTVLQALAADSKFELKDHRHRLKNYSQCFSAPDLIDWLLSTNQVPSREEGKIMGQSLLDADLIVPVAEHETVFNDEYCLFRFNNEELKKHQRLPSNDHKSPAQSATDPTHTVPMGGDLSRIRSFSANAGPAMHVPLSEPLISVGAGGSASPFNTSPIFAGGKRPFFRRGLSERDEPLGGSIGGSYKPSRLRPVDSDAAGEADGNPTELNNSATSSQRSLKPYNTEPLLPAQSQLAQRRSMQVGNLRLGDGGPQSEPSTPPDREPVTPPLSVPLSPKFGRRSHRRAATDGLIGLDHTSSALRDALMQKLSSPSNEPSDLPSQVGDDFSTPEPPPPTTSGSDGLLLSGLDDNFAQQIFPEPHIHTLVSEGREKIQALCQQLLGTYGVDTLWMDVIIAMTQRVCEHIRPNVRKKDPMDIRHHVKIKRVPGGQPNDTEYIHGVAFTQSLAHKHMASRITQPHVLLLRFPVEYQRVHSQLSSFDPLLLQERQYLKLAVDKVKSLGPDVILVQNNVSRIAQDYIHEAGISLVMNVKPSVMASIARCTGADILDTMDNVEPKNTGHCEEFCVRTFDVPVRNRSHKSVMYLSGCPPHLGCTIILRGGDMTTLHKVKQILRQMVYIGYSVALETHFLSNEYAMLPPGPRQKPAPVLDPVPNLAAMSEEARAQLDPHLLFRGALQNTTLSTSPHVQFESPYLYSDKGVESSVRKYFPPILYRSPRLQKLTGGYGEGKPNIYGTHPVLPSVFVDVIPEQPMPPSYDPEAINNTPYDNTTGWPELPAVGQKVKVVMPFSGDEDDIQAYADHLEFKLLRQQLLEKHVRQLNRARRAIGDNKDATPVEKGKEVLSKVDGMNSVRNAEDPEPPMMFKSILPAGGPERDSLGPLHHQSINFLFSWRLPGNGAPCKPPQLAKINYYGQNDVCFGEFLERNCFKQRNCDAEKCGRPMVEHVRSYVHGDAMLTLQVIETDPPNDYRDVILMWSVCRNCLKYAPCLPMSEESWRMSFGKFLEMSFYENEYGCKLSNGEYDSHSLHRSHLRYFGLGTVGVVFQYEPLDMLLELVAPSVVRVEDVPPDKDKFDKDVEEVKVLMGKAFDTMTEKLQNVLAKNDSPDAAKKRQIETQVMESQTRSRSEFKSFTENLDRTASRMGARWRRQQNALHPNADVSGSIDPPPTALAIPQSADMDVLRSPMDLTGVDRKAVGTPKTPGSKSSPPTTPPTTQAPKRFILPSSPPPMDDSSASPPPVPVSAQSQSPHPVGTPSKKLEISGISGIPGGSDMQSGSLQLKHSLSLGARVDQAAISSGTPVTPPPLSPIPSSEMVESVPSFTLMGPPPSRKASSVSMPAIIEKPLPTPRGSIVPVSTVGVQRPSAGSQFPAAPSLSITSPGSEGGKEDAGRDEKILRVDDDVDVSEGKLVSHEELEGTVMGLRRELCRLVGNWNETLHSLHTQMEKDKELMTTVRKRAQKLIETRPIQTPQPQATDAGHEFAPHEFVPRLPLGESPSQNEPPPTTMKKVSSMLALATMGREDFPTPNTPLERTPTLELDGLQSHGENELPTQPSTPCGIPSENLGSISWPTMVPPSPRPFHSITFFEKPPQDPHQTKQTQFPVLGTSPSAQEDSRIEKGRGSVVEKSSGTPPISHGFEHRSAKLELGPSNAMLNQILNPLHNGSPPPSPVMYNTPTGGHLLWHKKDNLLGAEAMKSGTSTASATPQSTVPNTPRNTPPGSPATSQLRTPAREKLEVCVEKTTPLPPSQSALATTQAMTNVIAAATLGDPRILVGLPPTQRPEPEHRRTSSTIRSIFTQPSTNTGFQYIKYPFSENERYVLPEGTMPHVLVYTDEPTSIIAAILSSTQYRQRIQATQKPRGSIKPTTTQGGNTAQDKMPHSSALSDTSLSSFNHNFPISPSTGHLSPHQLQLSNSKTPSNARVPKQNSGQNGVEGDGSQQGEGEPQEEPEGEEGEEEEEIYDAPPDSQPQDPEEGGATRGGEEHESDIRVSLRDHLGSVSCRVIYAREFEQLREKYTEGEEHYINSLSRCAPFHTSGGKSGLSFSKTKDGRYLLKQMSRHEVASIMQFAEGYLKYLFDCHKDNRPTVLAKVLGLYEIRVKNKVNKTVKHGAFLVMENIFYNRKIDHTFDLKGSLRSRYVTVDDPNTGDVLMDENLVEFLGDSPVYLRGHSKWALKTAIENDTLLLSNLNVMDYSLLVGLDKERKELVVGIIDYIRSYTWDKKMETWIKSSGILGGSGKMPTVVSPEVYEKRFRSAIESYFIMVPDKWTGMAINLK